MRIQKALAFVRRDFRIEASYKLNMVMTVSTSLLPLVTFYFISLLVDSDSPSLGKYGGNYFAFVIIGLSFSRYFELAVRTFSDSIRRAQMTGCLEAMLSSQTSPQTIVINSSFYSLLSAAVQLLIMLLVGVLFLGLEAGNINVLSTSVVFLLSVGTFVSFGILASASILLFKKGDPLVSVFTLMSSLLGGALFPVSVMPDWLQTVAAGNPFTYSLDALRLSMLQGRGLEDMVEPVVTLGIITLILLPLSLFLFSASVRKGRKEGTLMHY